MAYAIDNVRQTRINGRARKMFRLWNCTPDARLFIGYFTAAPRATADQMLDGAIQKLDAQYEEPADWHPVSAR